MNILIRIWLPECLLSLIRLEYIFMNIHEHSWILRHVTMVNQRLLKDGPRIRAFSGGKSLVIESELGAESKKVR
jgi:hypothetical protein